ncbi:MAG: ATP--cob(I)alamin adenosyltransferase [Pirellulaceae bacterium]|nr:MAG: ATP--cob(I)alamin adenosyltransferase [Pirellulaceae bacterium]
MRIYTRHGDGGQTGLLGGARVGKDHPRIAAFGEVDELNAAIGWARTCNMPNELQPLLERVQHELFALGAELASEDPASSGTDWISARHVEALESEIDQWEARLPPLRQFILPGGSAAAAALHWARCVCRRAERQLVQLMRQDNRVDARLLVYLNRLGDWLFVLARAANFLAAVGEVPWCSPPRRRGADTAPDAGKNP